MEFQELLRQELGPFQQLCHREYRQLQSIPTLLIITRDTSLKLELLKGKMEHQYRPMVMLRFRRMVCHREVEEAHHNMQVLWVAKMRMIMKMIMVVEVAMEMVVSVMVVAMNAEVEMTVEVEEVMTEIVVAMLTETEIVVIVKTEVDETVRVVGVMNVIVADLVVMIIEEDRALEARALMEAIKIELGLVLVVVMELDHAMTKSKFEKLFSSKEYP